jgi:hypothetical protein
VIIEVPHFASLRGKEREVVVMRSDNGESWYEHPLAATDEAVSDALGGSLEGLEFAGNMAPGSNTSMSSLWSEQRLLFFGLLYPAVKMEQQFRFKNHKYDYK